MENQHLTRGGLLARNVALNLGGWVLPALAALIAMPILVRGLGDVRFGVLALAWTTLGYFSLFDLGLGRAVTHGVADRLGAGNGKEREIGAVVWTSLAVLVPVGLLGTAVLFVLAPWLSRDVLGVPDELIGEMILGIRILALAIPFTGVTAALRGALEARQLFGVVNALRVPHGIVMFLGPVAALPFSRSVIPAIAILTAGRALLSVAHFVMCVKRVPHFGEARLRWRREILKPLVTFGGWMTVSNIISPLMATMDRFIVGAALSFGLVAYYAAPQELITKMWLFTAAVTPVFFPALATSALWDPQRTGMLFGRMTRVTFGVLFLPTLLIVLLARDVMGLWLGPAYAVQSTVVLQVLAVGVFVNTLGQCALTLIQGLGRPDITGKYHVAELPIYALLLWFLMPRFGLLGVALAWSIRAIGDALLLLLTCPRLLKESRPHVMRTFLWLLASVPVLVAGIPLSGTPLRFGVALLALPVWALIGWWVILRAELPALKALVTPASSREPA